MEVDGISIAKATAIQNASVVSGVINGVGHLILTTAGGTTIDAGQVVPSLPISATIAQYNTALSDQDFATLAKAETLTNKTLTAPNVTDLNITAGIGWSTYILKTADQSKSGFTVPSADADLFFPAATNATYVVDLNLRLSAANATNGGILVQIGAPANARIDVDSLVKNGTSVVNPINTYNSLTGATFQSMPANMPTSQLSFTGRVVVRNLTTAGLNIAVLWSQLANNANASTVLAGSYLVARRVA